MILTIGLMVGAIGLVVCLYVSTRFLQVFAPDLGKGLGPLVGIGAILGLVAAVGAMLLLGMGMADLMHGGSAAVPAALASPPLSRGLISPLARRQRERLRRLEQAHAALREFERT